MGVCEMSNEHGGARQGAGKPRKHLHLDRETSLLLAHVKRHAENAETEEQAIGALAFHASNWQALAYNAEVFAPELLSNPRWLALKTDLERRTEEIGVGTFIRSVGERYKEQLEELDDEE